MLVQVLVNDKDTVSRLYAAVAISKMGDTAIPKFLNLSDPDVDMKVKCQIACSIAYMESGSNVLFHQINNNRIHVGPAVVSALGVVGLGDTLLCENSGVSGDDCN